MVEGASLRHLIKFAIKEKELSVDPTANIKPIKGGKSTGHMTWKPPQVEQYRARHPVGTMGRVALELMLNIAARRTDVYQIGRSHMVFNSGLQMNVLTWRPQKTANSTGKVLSIPVLPFLQEALDAMPKGTALTFLTTDHGRPFKSAAAFGNKFVDWCDAAELPAVRCVLMAEHENWLRHMACARRRSTRSISSEPRRPSFNPSAATAASPSYKNTSKKSSRMSRQ